MQKDADRRIEVGLSGKKINKAMERADRENMLEVIVLGGNEIENRFFEIKDMVPEATIRVMYPVKSITRCKGNKKTQMLCSLVNKRVCVFHMKVFRLYIFSSIRFQIRVAI